jgi:hypothetical protein
VPHGRRRKAAPAGRLVVRIRTERPLGFADLILAFGNGKAPSGSVVSPE